MILPRKVYNLLKYLLIDLNGMSTNLGLFYAKGRVHIYIFVGFSFWHDSIDLVWFGFMAYQPLWVILSQIQFLHIYIKYTICKHFL